MGRLARQHRARVRATSSHGRISVGGANCDFDAEGRIRCDFPQGAGSTHKLDAGCHIITSEGRWHCPGVPHLHGKPVRKINRTSSDARSGNSWADIDDGVQVPAFPVSVGSRRASRFKMHRRRKKKSQSRFPRARAGRSGRMVAGDVGQCIASCAANHTPGTASYRACMSRCYGTGPMLNPSLPTGIVRGFGRPNNPSLPTGLPRGYQRARNQRRVTATDRITARPSMRPGSSGCCVKLLGNHKGQMKCQNANDPIHGKTVSVGVPYQKNGKPFVGVDVGGDVSNEYPVCVEQPGIDERPPAPPDIDERPECCVDAETSTLQQCKNPAHNGTPVQIIDVDPNTGTVMVVLPGETAPRPLPLCPQPPDIDERPPQCCVDAETSTLQQCSDPALNGTPVQIVDVDPNTGTVLVLLPGQSAPVPLPLCPERPKCPPGQVFDPATGRCRPDCPPCPEPPECPPCPEPPECPTCPPGYLLDTTTGECVQCPPPRECPPDGGPKCPPGYLLNEHTGECVQCPPPQDCPPQRPCPTPEPCVPPPGPPPCGDGPCPTPPGPYPRPPGSDSPPGECPPDGPCPVRPQPYPPPPGGFVPPCCENNRMGLPCPHVG